MCVCVCVHACAKCVSVHVVFELYFSLPVPLSFLPWMEETRLVNLIVDSFIVF